jgi:carbonic anhydrase/acetyltransferase-like protein (isoleucine patch superfamily)
MCRQYIDWTLVHFRAIVYGCTIVHTGDIVHTQAIVQARAMVDTQAILDSHCILRTRDIVYAQAIVHAWDTVYAWALVQPQAIVHAWAIVHTQDTVHAQAIVYTQDIVHAQAIVHTQVIVSWSRCIVVWSLHSSWSLCSRCWSHWVALWSYVSGVCALVSRFLSSVHCGSWSLLANERRQQRGGALTFPMWCGHCPSCFATSGPFSCVSKGWGGNGGGVVGHSLWFEKF